MSKRNGVYAPIGIEVNSHDCTINCQLYEFMNPDLAGLSVGPLIQTMCERSQRYAMSGKVIVVVGAGGSSKKFIWPAAKKENIRVSFNIFDFLKVMLELSIVCSMIE